MKVRNFPERRRLRQLRAQCRAIEYSKDGIRTEFRTPWVSIGSGSAAEVAAANAKLVEAMAAWNAKNARKVA